MSGWLSLWFLRNPAITIYRIVENIAISNFVPRAFCLHTDHTTNVETKGQKLSLWDIIVCVSFFRKRVFIVYCLSLFMILQPFEILHLHQPNVCRHPRVKIGLFKCITPLFTIGTFQRNTELLLQHSKQFNKNMVWQHD